MLYSTFRSFINTTNTNELLQIKTVGQHV